jgi:glycolate oxidase iron-sulfur subunit
LIEATRAGIEDTHRRSLGERLFRWVLFQTLPYPARLRVLALPIALAPRLRRSPLLRLLPRRVRALVSLAPSTPRGADPTAERTPAQGGPARRRVGLITGCVQQVFFADVNAATARVLSAEGCDVHAPRSQSCCGALALHAGRDDEAQAFARRLIAVFEREAVDEIVVNAAGCGSTLKEYGHLLAGDPAWSERAKTFSSKVRDVTETLTQLGAPRAPRHPLPLTVAYHDACHLAHAQGVRREPRELLAAVPGVSVTAVAESDICCGSAGIFNLVQPEMAADLGRRKARHLALTGADLVVTSNPGCILQLRAHGTQPVAHIVELLDASIRGVTLPACERS